jgi:uncharacterized protein (DUF1778 family)
MRVTEETRATIVEAADAQGTDLTSFVIDAAMTKARRVLMEERALRLTPAEASQIEALLATDAEVPAPLHAAARRLAESGL